MLIFQKTKTKPVENIRVTKELMSAQKKVDIMLKEIHASYMRSIVNHIYALHNQMKDFDQKLITIIEEALWFRAEETFSYFFPYNEDEMLKYGVMNDKDKNKITVEKAYIFWYMMHDRCERKRLSEFLSKYNYQRLSTQLISLDERIYGKYNYPLSQMLMNEKYVITPQNKLVIRDSSAEQDLKYLNSFMGSVI